MVMNACESDRALVHLPDTGPVFEHRSLAEAAASAADAPFGYRMA
ncbi:hypothetical protein [Streptomyces sp. NPDC006415]